ncbi:hypothetical protein [Pseudoruegeria sp. SK021]|uniref:hypothetical protein n=1 Tax=Pseudoruegeria sp. SK021 TaxID=1933035 RepID=UPI000A22874B|nr:hypothetical protein [Pseudoruegeria sp. SK021]OSP56540.1 hypothetical protein BV911_00825 [Pseudoruegeria sp. SK021]
MLTTSAALASPPLAEVAVQMAGAAPAVLQILPDWQASPPRAEFVLTDQSGTMIGQLPAAPLMSEWAFDGVQSLDIVDLNGDGAADVLAILNFVTGIGPTGMAPFPQAVVYLLDGQDFIPAPDLTLSVNETADFTDVAGVIAAIRAEARRIGG